MCQAHLSVEIHLILHWPCLQVPSAPVRAVCIWETHCTEEAALEPGQGGEPRAHLVSSTPSFPGPELGFMPPELGEKSLQESRRPVGSLGFQWAPSKRVASFFPPALLYRKWLGAGDGGDPQPASKLQGNFRPEKQVRHLVTVIQHFTKRGGASKGGGRGVLVCGVH